MAIAALMDNVMTVIFDLDQPAKGSIGVSQQPMHELYDRLNGQN
jgi:hypothetical protein